MRDIERDKQVLWYCNVIDSIELKDDDGNYTGEHYDVLSKPIEYNLGVSATVGDPSFSPFGYNLTYSREITTCDRTLVLSEGDVLFIDIVPTLDSDGMLAKKYDGRYVTEPDYYVKKIMNTQKGNNARYGIAKKV